jgi:hypothetical protein
VVTLSDVPTMPPEDEMARLQASFFASFNHIFLDGVDVADWSSNPLPPYLQVALACLGAAASASATNTGTYALTNASDQADVSAGLFIAAARLWTVIIEVDNREARMLEAVIAVRAPFLHGCACLSNGRHVRP